MRSSFLNKNRVTSFDCSSIHRHDLAQIWSGASGGLTSGGNEGAPAEVEGLEGRAASERNERGVSEEGARLQVEVGEAGAVLGESRGGAGEGYVVRVWTKLDRLAL